ncbi:putative MFS family arabinose efflux permease [Pseudomonas sp. BIGb0450]|jgi:predicted MFS family arabinose efflux permease|uniref:MFS transporter n=1 Tax=unclassified Pseudomonas TaxID=196821 RepID=UPI002167F460|nr:MULTISPECIES: MFS transporter [unclassified Pseudomonas]MCS3419369.1 putative MFS family arabinose efflux permease [Pseudomonas sp. BIGb0558]MCS3438259.1 putative MFS family arabinose efflux permease [Pseudomonas sp. BIGb0450]
MNKAQTIALDPRIWLLALGTFAIGTDVFVVSGILSLMAHDLNVSLESAGLSVTAYALTYALAAPFIVPLTVSLNQRSVCVATLSLFAAGNILCALAQSYEVLIAARVLAGLAAALYTSTAYALATSLAPANRKGAALSAVALGLTASAVFGVPIGAAIGQTIGWRATFWLVAVISGAAMLALSMRPLADQRVQVFTRLNYMERYAPLFQRRVLFALLPSMFWNTANLTSYTYLGARLAEQHSPKTVIFLFFVYGVGGLTGSQIGGRVLDRFGATIPLVTCLAVAAINQALMEVSSLSTITTAFALALWSISGWATFAPQQARLISLSPHNSALLIAVNHSIIYIGFATGAAIGGAAIAHGVNVSQLHWVTTILLVAALLIFLLGVKREKAFCFSSPD